MSLIHWQPLREINALRQQMNSLFDEWIHGERTTSLLPTSNLAWVPAIELKQTDTDIILKAEIPGIEAKDLDVEVSTDAVLIAGEYQREKREPDKGFIRSEFRYGQFQRVVPLPVAIQSDRVKAEFKNGVLTLTLPKVEAAKRNVVKLDLTTQQAARQAMTKERQHQEHLQDTMHARTLEELAKQTSNSIKEEARESLAEERHYKQHLQDTMHTRAATEVSTPDK
ncbi:Hsp20/alpha crystallin family protein [Chlorogloeopsis sp. ULAP01]|uniref:Hsp20/alpha crystallin family protein n=1 Tax=Chlorogloeopsis sp. ULAP01 TaxID=3056483 RepID=UPI0025AB2BA8|nr:Hsp20/alpha crystallin family protein [Chlorogloeopsis sp. ULAP01]MDM9383817.1 Hsp20/alpha crystallin family protein [Chlorogloeopsis sp. ULAP01]